MWLRDTLPEFMQASGIFPRVMTYGWNANVWIDSSNQRTTEAAMALVHNVDAVREQVRQLAVYISSALTNQQ